MSRPRHLWRWVIGLGALAGIVIGVFISINLLRGKTDGPVQVVDAPADVVALIRDSADADSVLSDEASPPKSDLNADSNVEPYASRSCSASTTRRHSGIGLRSACR